MLYVYYLGCCGVVHGVNAFVVSAAGAQLIAGCHYELFDWVRLEFHAEYGTGAVDVVGVAFAVSLLIEAGLQRPLEVFACVVACFCA